MPQYQPGQIVDGYRFNGGNQRDQNSWTELKGQDLIGSLPVEDQSLVKGIVNYDLPPGSMRGGLGSPQVQRLLSLAARADPNFSAGDYSNRVAVKKNYTSGKTADTITAFNTTIDHLGTLFDDAKALDNFGGMATPLNYIKNPVQSMFGDPRVGNFNNDKKAVAGESVKAFTGAQGGEGDRKEQQDNYSPYGAPEQQRQSILHTAMLLKSKLHEMDATYSRGLPGHSVFELLSPGARATLDRLSQIDKPPAAPLRPGRCRRPVAPRDS
jgi:hypothetical protein